MFGINTQKSMEQPRPGDEVAHGVDLSSENVQISLGSARAVEIYLARPVSGTPSWTRICRDTHC